MNHIDGIDYCDVCRYFAGAFGCTDGACRRPSAPGPATLSFTEFNLVNRARCSDPTEKGGFDDPVNSMGWGPVEWAAAIGEEAGEVLGAALGVEGLKGSKSKLTDQDLADEIADVVIYCDLLATRIGRTLAGCITAKFNRVSEKRGSFRRLPAASRSMVALAPTEALLPEWHRFPDELPPERKLVLVQIGIGSADVGLPAAMVAGYLRFAAGDKNSPFFVTPGVDRRDERRVEFWCDCLPESFQPPAWRFPDRPPARIAAPPAGDLPAHPLSGPELLVRNRENASRHIDPSDYPGILGQPSVGDLPQGALCECGHAKSEHCNGKTVCRNGWMTKGTYVVQGCRCGLFEAPATPAAAQGALATPGERARAHALLTALGFSCVDTTCGWNGQPHQRNCDAAHEALSAVENEGKAAMLELAKVSAAALRDAGVAATPAAQRRPAREIIHDAMKKAGERGCCNLPACAFGGSTETMLCEELELALEADRRGER